MMGGGIVLRLAATVYFLPVAASGTVAAMNGTLHEDAPRSHGNNHRGGQKLMPAIMLALKAGSAGESTLLAWSTWADDVISSHRTPPAVWVICTDTAAVAPVAQTPHVNPFLVSDEASWAAALVIFLSQNPWLSGVGLFGEGALPHPELIDSIESVQLALFEAVPPTAILTRSRAKGDIPGEERWLPDNFVSQLWCNRASLEAPMLTKAGLAKSTPQDTTLLEALPMMIRDAVEKKLILVDGTHVIGSTFDAPPAPARSSSGDEKPPSVLSKRRKAPRLVGAGLHIGSLDFALVYDSSDDDTGRGDLREEGRRQAAVVKTSSIVKAPWPPEYVLEAVAMNTTSVASKGLVLVSNVNCGYLDMATNFLLSVRSNSEAKVLFVAMDEISFDFMDALDPGCAALFPRQTTERQGGSIRVNQVGSSGATAAALVRPFIISSILRQNYAVLWSDSDTVWLGNPLPLLPQLDDTTGADVMLQNDDQAGNTRTCFMFLKPTMTSRMLLNLWGQAIAERHPTKNQKLLQGPVSYMQKAGLRVDFISPEIIPAGNDFFDHNYRKDYTRVYHEGAQIVHNNVVRGHGVKKRRFQRYHVWSVSHIFFPRCGRQRSSGKAKALSEARALNGGLASNNATALNNVKASNIVTPTFFFQTASADSQKASGARSSMGRGGRRGWSSAVLMSCLPLFLLGVFSLAYCVGRMKCGAPRTVGVAQ